MNLAGQWCQDTGWPWACWPCECDGLFVGCTTDNGWHVCSRTWLASHFRHRESGNSLCGRHAVNRHKGVNGRENRSSLGTPDNACARALSPIPAADKHRTRCQPLLHHSRALSYRTAPAREGGRAGQTIHRRAGGWNNSSRQALSLRGAGQLSDEALQLVSPGRASRSFLSQISWASHPPIEPWFPARTRAWPALM